MGSLDQTIMHDRNGYKEEILDFLSNSRFLVPEDPNFFHGRIYGKSQPPAPKVLWASSETPRHDHDAPEWLTATEYIESEDVLEDKVEWLIALLKISSKTVIYTGAGISTAAGVEQAARGVGGQKKKIGCSTEAEPTFTHKAISALHKAGFPQEDIVEIHGSWYDPSNPVVCYDGNLKQDHFQKMKDAADEADLVLVLGTSLSGLNSDRVAKDPAQRSLTGKSLGTVIVNLQQTKQDGISSLRIFSQTDAVFSSLLDKLSLSLPSTPKYNEENRAVVPYNKYGRRSTTTKMVLDLSEGQPIRLNPNHNCQGSRQGAFMHIGATQAIKYRGKVRKPGPGIGIVLGYSEQECGWKLEVEGVHMLLGGWWLRAAQKGELQFIPVINMDPKTFDVVN